MDKGYGTKCNYVRDRAKALVSKGWHLTDGVLDISTSHIINSKKCMYMII
jgi:hypothetical protein